MLLDIWDAMAREPCATPPGLLIIGRRGWNNKAVFDRLDTLPHDSAVKELSDLPDGAVAALLAGSTGLLFPSHAEGFGLPPAEAAALGIPVISSDLPVIREILADIPVYVSSTERYQWEQAIQSLLKDHGKDGMRIVGPAFIPPTWDAHFNTVLRFT